MGRKISDPLVKRGFIQALGITLYCSSIGSFIWTMNKIFPKDPNYFGPVAFLLLFSFSALVCALIVFYKPYRLFFDDKKKDAIDLVLFTTGWLFVFLVTVFIFAFAFPKS
ncbi:MAG: hypothetical protein US62_C0009G0022 [Candidatus Woesebacteria bacterium GW2011_GWA1_37_8]|uniref:Uncharacterized protein n=2 Tax=Candidatus Woeseibacteriota TaxID=1752722 RepID=A0A0G0NLB8_9BACT|nr:MAG: hypothetical protein US39_C0002G0062 [Microgenomates group bacterium GW2011_GWC1_37_12b]KKQ45791.1 MAG: hypothetical protein US62_C0009G0022 [Candidatus Woesebacteria bacterium GW2011_GWA1_37_8]KKQ86679.1 MAG: hypothetical protein UT10_C0019G0039 [Candidatus Woesebacteria bacterium GW2011_GWB1_38_8b]